MQKKNPSQTFEGALWTYARDIRDIRLYGTELGAFCVVDDGYDNYPAHAVIGFSEVEEKLKNHRQAARGELLTLLKRNGIAATLEDCPFQDVGSTA